VEHVVFPVSQVGGGEVSKNDGGGWKNDGGASCNYVWLRHDGGASCNYEGTVWKV